MVGQRARVFVFHPFFFAAYAVLGIYSSNANEIPVQWVWRPLIFLLFLTAILFYLLQKRLLDLQRAGLITTLVLFWSFFGHIQRFLVERSLFWTSASGTLLGFFLWTSPLFLIGSHWAWSRITNPKFITTFLNSTSAVVLLLPGLITGRTTAETIWSSTLKDRQSSTFPSVSLKAPTVKPDIYLIILDAYGRDDFLREVYGFDNRPFIDYLDRKGFYVARQSSPNYPMTWLSLSSSLNFNYLDDFARPLQETQTHEPFYDLIQHSRARQLLDEAGYQFVALPSAALFTQMRDADRYYKMTLGDLNEFEGLLLSSTVANFGIDALKLDVPVPSYRLQRSYMRYSLDMLKKMPQVDDPKFVFAHLMAPHPPFVVDQFGNDIEPDREYNMGDASGFMGTPEEYRTGYVNEVQFLNRQLMDVIDEILATSETPPIIIVQGDHGPGSFFNLKEPVNPCMKERYSILNAYYFPDRNYQQLYSSITPVNSFRVVLDQFFGANLEMLADKNYYSTWGAPLQFDDVSDQISSCDLPALD